MLHRGWMQLAGPALDVEKIEVAALCLGLAQAAYDDAYQYAQERRQFGKPISAHQSIRHMLADLATEQFASRLMVTHCERLLQDRQPCPVETFMAQALRIRVGDAYRAERPANPRRLRVRDGVRRPAIPARRAALPNRGGSSAIQRNNIIKRLRLPE